jgi:hypothetical protein
MNSNATSDFLDTNDGQAPRLPSFLNVLTILTLVGCAIELITAAWRYISAEKSVEQMVDAQNKLEGAPEWAKKMAGPEALALAQKALENKLPLLLVTLAGTALCLWGALEMRKLKKQGFVLWLVGESLPIIGSVIILGTGVFAGLSALILIFPLIFMIMYAVNRKHLLY